MATDRELLQYAESIERCEDEKKEINQQVKDIKAEMKSRGYDMKAFAQILKERRMDSDERETHVQMCDLYRTRIGALDGTPLGDAAAPRSQQSAPEAGKGEADAIHARGLENARQQGWNDGREGKKPQDNPYTSDDPRFEAWEEARASIVPARVAA